MYFSSSTVLCLKSHCGCLDTVSNDMMKFAHAMIINGQATRWNIAFQFLRIYHFIFRRISHGATRLQEVLADRIAAQNFGGQAFEEGLRHVVRRGIEFNQIATKEINEAVDAQRAVQNFYELGPEAERTVEEEINTAIHRQ